MKPIPCSIVTAVVLTTVGMTHAQFLLFDNFDSLVPGPLNGQDGWTSTGGTVVNDPEDPLNKVAGFVGGTGDRGTYKALNIPNGTTATLFFRMRVDNNNADLTTLVQNWSIGMSDLAITGQGAFADFETQLNMNRDTGNTAPQQVRARSAGTFNTLDDMWSNHWYYVWMVIDNAADRFSVYLHGGQLAAQTLTDDPSALTSFTFRNSGGGVAANDLIRFFVRLASTHQAGFYMDDLYLDSSGQNLSYPAAFNTAAPIAFTIQPTNQTIWEGIDTAEFVSGVAGGPPRYIQWQRSDGFGGFTNVPGANVAILSLTNLTLADSGSIFRLAASNLVGQSFSQEALLTVAVDTNPPTVLAVSGKHTMTNIYVHFSELVAPGSATDGFNYSINGGAVSVRSAKLTGDGSTVLLATDPLMPDTDYTVVVTGVYDRAFNPNLIGTPNAATLRSWVFSPGFLVAELFLGITGNAIGDLTADPRYPDLADTNFFVADGQSPTALAENYGGHLVGYIVPPVSGTYTFYIRGDDGTELRLGSGADPASLVTVAAVTAANQPFTSGTSPAQTLVGGQPYIIEALWKEGTGGDYVQIGWMPPWDPNITIIPCAYLATYADAAGASVTITNHPRSQTGYQLRTVTLTVGAAGTPAENPLCYQWQRADGLGGYTNVSGANGPTYTTPLLQFPGDDGAVFRVVVRAPGGVVATSEEAVIAVVVDNDPPVLLSAMSLDGSSIDLCYSEHLETNDLGSGPVALDTFGYKINGGAVGILRAEWAVDYSSVILFLDGTVQSGFTVTISPDDLPIRDLAGNVIQTSQTVTGMVAGLTALDVGNPSDPVEAGLTFLCGSDRIVMRGGGSDIWSTNDHCQFVFREMEGDFDVRARVESIEQINVWSKVGIMARVSTNANSRNVTMLVTPPGGQNTYTFQWRATTEGASVSSHRGNGGPVFDPTYPNAWLRLRRAGAVLTGLYSSNGLDWLVQASHDSSTSAEGALPSTLLVGLAITSHDNGAGQATEAVIRDLSFAAVTVPPEFSRIEYQGGNVLLEFPTQAGASYTIEYKLNLNDALWQTLTTVPGTGGLAQSIDPNPAEQSRFYRLRAD